MKDYTIHTHFLVDQKVLIIPQNSDNYSYLLIDAGNGILIDPSEEKILDILQNQKINLTHILSTHHHQDHVAANLYLKKKTGCKILGPNDSRIPGLSTPLKDEEVFTIENLTFRAIHTPSHTKSHMVYYLENQKALFSGDTLFVCGCGRLFEGSAQDMESSLEKIKKLPKETQIFCGHEYTIKNLKFAISLDNDNSKLKEELTKAEMKISKNIPTVPSTLEFELKFNPFMKGQTIEEFSEIREKRNEY